MAPGKKTGLLRALQNHPDVEALSIDAVVSADGVAADLSATALSTPYSLRRTLGLEAATDMPTESMTLDAADDALYTAPSPASTGAGVTVAVIDSGLLLDEETLYYGRLSSKSLSLDSTSLSTASRIITTRDFTTGLSSPGPTAAVDPFGHGTHVGGLIGDDQAEMLIRGVAPNVDYVSVRVLSAAGAGQTSNVINAIEWAVAHRETFGIDVINLSLGLLTPWNWTRDRSTGCRSRRSVRCSPATGAPSSRPSSPRSARCGN